MWSPTMCPGRWTKIEVVIQVHQKQLKFLLIVGDRFLCELDDVVNVIS